MANEGTIHTYHNCIWEGRIYGVGQTNKEDVLLVRSDELEAHLEFYAEEESDGKHPSVGNRAFWFTRGDR